MKRKRLFPRIRSRDPGSPPGELIPELEAGKPVIDVIAFTPDTVGEQTDVTLETLTELRKTSQILWVNVTGLGDAAKLLAIGQLFDLHQLALEDVVNTQQRPKVEEYDNHLFLVLRMLSVDGSFDSEQISLFLGRDFVLTLQETPGDCLQPVRQRLQLANGRLRRHGADYLCYAIIDAVVDFYYPALDKIGERLEELEEEVVNDPDPAHVRELHELKRDLLSLRRVIWPQREVMNGLIRDDYGLIKKATRPFLRDCYDHTVQLMDILETYREIASGLLDVHISSVSARLNEIMKVLTIIATLFMPLGFIASLYGMNFDRTVSPYNMPELGWYFGYPFALLVMAASAFGMLWFFRRKGWIGRFRDRD